MSIEDPVAAAAEKEQDTVTKLDETLQLLEFTAEQLGIRKGSLGMFCQAS